MSHPRIGWSNHSRKGPESRSSTHTYFGMSRRSTRNRNGREHAYGRLPCMKHVGLTDGQAHWDAQVEIVGIA